MRKLYCIRGKPGTAKTLLARDLYSRLGADTILYDAEMLAIHSRSTNPFADPVLASVLEQFLKPRAALIVTGTEQETQGIGELAEILRCDMQYVRTVTSKTASAPRVLQPGELIIDTSHYL